MQYTLYLRCKANQALPVHLQTALVRPAQRRKTWKRRAIILKDTNTITISDTVEVEELVPRRGSSSLYGNISDLGQEDLGQ